MARKQLPIGQRHRKGCTRPRDCGCPWRPRVRDAAGKFRGRTWDTYAEAEQEYYELKAQRPDPLADRTTTIAQWAERWVASANWRKGTRAANKSVLKVHILPHLGHYTVTGLRSDDVRLWVAGMRERGVGPTAMHSSYTALRTMYGAWLAADRQLPYGIPVPTGLVKAQPRKEFIPLTPAQVAAWTAAATPDMRLIMEAQAFYGARMSEILALRDEDISFTFKDVTAPLGPQLATLAALDEGTYDARKPRLRFARKLERDRTPGPIKNKRGNRTLPLPQWLAAAFAAQFEQWPPVDGWLFTNPRSPGSPRFAPPAAHPHPVGESEYRLWLRKAAAAAGIVLPQGMNSHALRHYCVSVLRDQGKSDQAIGYWIGDTAEMVTRVYGRPPGDAMDRIAADLNTIRVADPQPRLRAVPRDRCDRARVAAGRQDVRRQRAQVQDLRGGGPAGTLPQAERRVTFAQVTGIAAW